MPLLPPPVLPELGTVMYIWGWDGQGVVPLWGSAGLRGGPGPAPRAVNVFRAGGEGDGASCFRGKGGQGLPLGLWVQWYFILVLFRKGWERLLGGRGGRRWACCGYWHILSQL